MVKCHHSALKFNYYGRKCVIETKHKLRTIRTSKHVLSFRHKGLDAEPLNFHYMKVTLGE